MADAAFSQTGVSPRLTPGRRAMHLRAPRPRQWARTLTLTPQLLPLLCKEGPTGWREPAGQPGQGAGLPAQGQRSLAQKGPDRVPLRVALLPRSVLSPTQSTQGLVSLRCPPAAPLPLPTKRDLCVMVLVFLYS